jgi:hypothetical protein
MVWGEATQFTLSLPSYTTETRTLAHTIDKFLDCSSARISRDAIRLARCAPYRPGRLNSRPIGITGCKQ